MKISIQLLIILLVMAGELDSQTFQWAFGSSGVDTSSRQTVHGIAVDKLGNSFVVGSFENEIKIGDTLLTSDGMEDALIAKINSRGALIWARSGGGRETDRYYS